MISAGRSRVARAGVAALALTLGVAPAAAQGPAAARTAAAEREVVVVLPLSGDLDSHVARPLEARVAAGLRRGRFTVVDADEVRARQPAGECGPACLQEVGRASGANYLVRIAVTVVGRDYEVRLALLAAGSGEAAVTSAEVCEICGHEELAERVGDMAAALRRKLGAAVDPAPRLRVLSRPEGSGVTIDGAVVGVTPLDITVTPGEHHVTVEHPGYVAHRRRLLFGDGITRTITTELGPVPLAPLRLDRPRPTWRLTPLGGTSLALGLGATAAGLALVLIHQRPLRSDCAGENVDAMGDCKWRHDTLAGGVALSLVGVAAVTLGVALLVVERRRSRRSRVAALPAGFGLRF